MLLGIYLAVKLTSVNFRLFKVVMTHPFVLESYEARAIHFTHAERQLIVDRTESAE